MAGAHDALVLIAHGARRIRVLPVFWAGADRVQQRLPPMLAQARDHISGCRPRCCRCCWNCRG